MVSQDGILAQLGKKLVSTEGVFVEIGARRLHAALARFIWGDKTRPARLFLEKMGQSPADVLTPDALDRFERLIVTINEKLARHIARDAGTFH